MINSTRLPQLLAAVPLVVLALGVLGGTTAVAGPTPPTTLYVSTTGSDTADGRAPDRPFATLQHALDVAESGTTIQLAAGRYLQDATTRRPGVTVQGPRSAVLSGSGSAARILQVQHDDTTLRGFTVDGLVGPASEEASYRDKLIYVMSTTPGDGVDRLRITGMRLINAGGECLRLRYLITRAEVDHNQIERCGVFDFVFAGGGKNGEGVYLGTAPEQQGKNGAPDDRADVSRDNAIHHNLMDTQGNECVDVKENSTANVISDNYCTGQLNSKSGGMDSRGSGNTFTRNVIVDNLGAGVRLGGDTPTDGTDNVVINNVIIRNAAGGIKFQATPQRQVCGNAMAGNVGGDAVGTYAAEYHPTDRCAS